MAIGPQDLQVLTPEDEANVGKIEKLIDEKLQANYDIGGAVRLNIANMADVLKCKLTYKMRKELVSRYEKVGWAIETESTPTSEFFTLSEPKPQTAEEVRDAMIPEMSADNMMDRMAEAREPKSNSGPVSPFKSLPPTSRGDYDDPYSRKKLNTRP